MAYKIGQCCVDQVTLPPIVPLNPPSATNETIPFTNLSTLRIIWDATRIAKYGPSGTFYVEVLGDDGIYRQGSIEIIPDSVVTTTYYDLNFGAVTSGRVTIT